jgi:hypothetical protein
MRFKVGDRVRANERNVYVGFPDQTVSVGTTGTVLKIKNGLYLVDYDAEWNTPLMDPGEPVEAWTFDDELEAVE